MKPENLKRFLFFPVILFLTIACAISTPKTRYLGGVYFTDEGGYEIQKVNEYAFDEFPGGFEMVMPDTSPLEGPGFIVYGGLIDQDRTTKELWDFITQEDFKNFQFEEPKERKIDSYNGLIADFHGIQENTAVRGKLFAVMIDQKQQFIMLGFSPEDEWRKFEPLYDMVLKTVKFYIPNRMLQFEK